MTKPRNQTLRQVMRKEQSRLASQRYPGDLASDVLNTQHSSGPRQPWRQPLLAFALLGIGLAIGMALLNKPSQIPPPEHVNQPAPVLEQNDETAADQPTEPTPPLPTTTVASTAPASPLPEIDRDLLPLQRNSQATWLASARPHKQQLDKQSRLAEHPKPSKRLRPTLSAPTRREIGRAIARPLNLQPAPKPERTS